MPKEYADLVAALKLTDIPFVEYGWKTRPEGAYGVIGLDYESGNLNGDCGKLDRTWEGSVDLFYPRLTDADDLIEEVEETLETVLENAWQLNSIQYETETGLFHVEWTFEALDVPEPEEEPQPVAEPAETDGQEGDG